MKHLNRNLYLIIVGIAEVLFFTYAMVLYRRGTIDSSDLQMGGILAGGVGVLAVILSFSKSSWSGENKEGNFNPALSEVSHTREGIIFEALTGLIIVGAWILAFASDRFWIIDNFFSFLHLALMFVLSILTITFLWIVYLPSFKSKIRKHNVEQVVLEVRMCRVLAVEFALFVLASALPLGDYSIVCIFIIGVALLLTIAIFRYLIYQVRHNFADDYSSEKNENAGDFDIDKVKMPRTALGTLTEILIGALVVIAWVMSAINGRFAEDDGSLNIGTLFVLLPCTIGTLKLIWDTYKPGNMRDVGQLTNLKQAKLAVLLYRMFALMLGIIMLLYAFPSISKSIDPLWVLVGYLAILAILFFIFRTLIRRAGDQQGH